MIVLSMAYGGDRTNPNRVLNPVRVTRDWDVPPPPPPDPLHKRGRAERRSAVIGNTGRQLITNKGASPLAERGHGGRTASAAPRHCERSEAIAHTTDTHSVSATASSLAVTASAYNSQFSILNSPVTAYLLHTVATFPQRAAHLLHTEATLPQLAAHLLHTEATFPQPAAYLLHTEATFPQRAAYLLHTAATFPQNTEAHAGDRTNPNRVLNPVRVTRDWDAVPPPPPDPLHKRGRAERRIAVVGNTNSYLIILNSQFSILNSKEGRAERRSADRGDSDSSLNIFPIEQKPSASRHGKARRCPPLLRGGRRCVTVLFSTHRLKPGAIQTTARHCSPSFGGGRGEAAIAHTTDTRSAPATASSLAVTTSDTTARHRKHSLSPSHGGGWGEAASIQTNNNNHVHSLSPSHGGGRGETHFKTQSYA
jgi:hypothetical protein